MADLTYRLFADNELLCDSETIKLFQQYNIPGWIIPTTGFSNVKLYQDEKGKESKLLYIKNPDIQKFIKGNFIPYRN